jgi:hypothetical protein
MMREICTFCGRPLIRIQFTEPDQVLYGEEILECRTCDTHAIQKITTDGGGHEERKTFGSD